MCKFISVIDAWGKLPSAVFSGNFYELGGFSQCFDIQKNDVTLKTQYCMGKLNVDHSQTATVTPEANPL